MPDSEVEVRKHVVRRRTAFLHTGVRRCGVVPHFPARAGAGPEKALRSGSVALAAALPVFYSALKYCLQRGPWVEVACSVAGVKLLRKGYG